MTTVADILALACRFETVWTRCGRFAADAQLAQQRPDKLTNAARRSSSSWQTLRPAIVA